MTYGDTASTDETNSSAEVPVPRQDWEAQCQRMAENNDNALLDGDWSLTKWDEAEWEW